MSSRKSKGLITFLKEGDRRVVHGAVNAVVEVYIDVQDPGMRDHVVDDVGRFVEIKDVERFEDQLVAEVSPLVKRYGTLSWLEAMNTRVQLGSGDEPDEMSRIGARVQLGGPAKLDDISRAVARGVAKVCGGHKSWSSSMQIIDVPPFKVENPEIELDIKLTRSVSGISELVRCGVLYVMNPKLIEFGALDLLRIPGLHALETWSGEIPEWFKILQKYAGAENKNILAWQEELIDSGLEEFAEI
jgi:hypothetical protein